MEVRTAASPRDVKHYTTDRLREEFLIQDLFQADKINLVYSHIDRIITLSGAKIPAKISRMIARFYDAPDALAEAGTAYAVDQIIDLLSGGARGAHVYVMNNAAVAERIAAGVLPVIREINGENHGH